MIEASLLSKEELDGIEEEVRREVEAATQEALGASDPDPATDLQRDVYKTYA